MSKVEKKWRPAVRGREGCQPGPFAACPRPRPLNSQRQLFQNQWSISQPPAIFFSFQKIIFTTLFIYLGSYKTIDITYAHNFLYDNNLSP